MCWEGAGLGLGDFGLDYNLIVAVIIITATIVFNRMLNDTSVVFAW